MPRYEIVTHLQVDLDGATPEDAAALFKRTFLTGNGARVRLRNLAVWRPDSDAGPTPLPSPLPRHLEAFFSGVARSAAVEEETFRRRVEAIFAGEGPGAFDPDRDTLPARPMAPEVGAGPATAAWEDEGGSIESGLTPTKEAR